MEIGTRIVITRGNGKGIPAEVVLVKADGRVMVATANWRSKWLSPKSVRKI